MATALTNPPGLGFWFADVIADSIMTEKAKVSGLMGRWDGLMDDGWVNNWMDEYTGWLGG